jgi:hypothetical protein
LTIYISDQADEFRIEISGRFADAAVEDAATAWRSALMVKVPRRISVDITRMTGYDSAGYSLLRDIYKHGTHIVAGTPRSLLFLTQISSARDLKRRSTQVYPINMRAAASGE